jgi:hypothetical protein
MGQEEIAVAMLSLQQKLLCRVNSTGFKKASLELSTLIIQV